MTDHDLKKLKNLPVPPASARAKAAALGAALEAFNQNGDAAENNDDAAQGKVTPLRQTHMTSKSPRRKSMRLTRSTYAIAASLLVTAVSVPVVMMYIKRSGMQPLSSEVHTGLAGRGDEAHANKPAKVATEKSGTRRVRQVAAKPSADADKSAHAPVIALPPPAEMDALRTEPKRKLALKKEAFADQTLSGRMAALPTAPADYSLLGLQQAASPSPRGRIVATLQRPDVMPPRAPAYEGRDKFEAVAANPVKQVASEPVSTFSVDVDTASYSFVRRALNAGRLPQKNAVRIEELINYFAYDYTLPETRDKPFQPAVTVMPSPWNAQNKLVHIGIKGYALKSTERPRANLVLLIDVSGSMGGPDRLPLLKNAFRMLVDNLQPDDTIGIVTYASGSGVALAPTRVADKGKILAAIDKLHAGGSTAGAKGIQDAYALAEAGFDKKAVNRVILGTDGDFNVGISDRNELKSYIERKRKSGIFLSILGVGRGNYNDALMQTLAQNGNGTAAYIDTLNEARKVLVDEAAANLFPIAKDVKIQIEFNPARISQYRLIGYETRALKREDFNNDKVDAGDIGSSHTVTAIYEVTPVGAEQKLVDDLRYGKTAAKPAAAPVDGNAEFAFLKLRYKLPMEDNSRLISLPVSPSLQTAIDAAPADVRFSTAVAAFGQLLRGGAHMGSFGYDDVIKLAASAKGADPYGLRAEFVNLVRLAKTSRP